MVSWVTRLVIGLLLTLISYMLLDRTVGINGLIPTVVLVLVVIGITDTGLHDRSYRRTLARQRLLSC